MRYEKPKYEFPIDWQDWHTAAARPAGIWWLDGRTYLAGFGSRAEAALAGAGAFHVATLQFEPDPLETVHRDRVVEVFGARAMLRLLEPAGALSF